MGVEGMRFLEGENLTSKTSVKEETQNGSEIQSIFRARASQGREKAQGVSGICSVRGASDRVGVEKKKNAIFGG